MRTQIGVIVFAAILLAVGPAFAIEPLLDAIIKQNTPSTPTADDYKWVSKCISDNQNEGATMEVVKTYCECMNNKMDESETRSISTWERTHPQERKECERKAGWK